jgi:Holliday junction resolvase RusA-like endonuclease
MRWETIYGQVISKANSYMVANSGGTKHIIKNEQIRSYERSFIQQCNTYKGRRIDSHFKLHIKVYSSSVRFDLDNALKTVLDCLQYVGAISNDSNCFSIDASKYIDERHPRIEFAIEEMNEQTKLF